MNLDELVSEAAALPSDQRKALIGRLIALGRGEGDAAYRQMLADKIDDTNPDNWVPLEDLSKHLRLNDGSE